MILLIRSSFFEITSDSKFNLNWLSSYTEFNNKLLNFENNTFNCSNNGSNNGSNIDSCNV